MGGTCWSNYRESKKPEFADFLKFVKTRARLFNNEFGEDLLSVASREKRKGVDKTVKPELRIITMATGLPSEQDNRDL